MRQLRVEMVSTIDGYGDGEGPMTGDDPTFPRMTELPKIVFSKTLRPPLKWANSTIVDEPVETAVPALKAAVAGFPSLP